MSEDYLKMFTGVVLLIFVIIAGYFFSERNDRKMFLLSSLVFLVKYRVFICAYRQSLVSVWCNYESGGSTGCFNSCGRITGRYELRQVQKNIYLYYVVISMVRSDVVFYKGAYDRLSHIKRS